jgi:hypothetical protein
MSLPNSTKVKYEPYSYIVKNKKIYAFTESDFAGFIEWYLVTYNVNLEDEIGVKLSRLLYAFCKKHGKTFNADYLLDDIFQDKKDVIQFCFENYKQMGIHKRGDWYFKDS